MQTNITETTRSVTSRSWHALPAPQGLLLLGVAASLALIGHTRQVHAQVLCDPEIKVYPSDGAAHDVFSRRLDISGVAAIAGATDHDVAGKANQGSVYFYRYNGATWLEEQTLTSTDGAANDLFGYGVAIDGDTAVVGAVRHDGPTAADQGAAYVYERIGGVWTFVIKLQIPPAEAAAGDRFGNFVAIDNDVIMVNANGDDTVTTDAGAVFVYRRIGGVWTFEAKLTASDGATGDEFGTTIAIDGDTAVFGAWFDDGTSANEQGAAYVFVRDGGVWSEQAKLTASDAQFEDRLGVWVDVDGDTAAIGAQNDNHPGGGSDQGSVYIYDRTGTVWTESVRLFASDAIEADRFGASLSLSGDTLHVGAWNDDEGGLSDSGSVYVFSRVGGAWVERGKIVSSDAEGGDQFGRVVKSDGDWLMVSADGNDDLGPDAGAAYFIDAACALCPADLDGDGDIDGADLGLFLGNWGNPGTTDLSGDGTTDGADLGLFLALWGPCG